MIELSIFTDFVVIDVASAVATEDKDMVATKINFSTAYDTRDEDEKPEKVRIILSSICMGESMNKDYKGVVATELSKKEALHVANFLLDIFKD